MKYLDEAREIWTTLVPPYGPAESIQGELLRAVDQLRVEAQCNGNINWEVGNYADYVPYLRARLIDSRVFNTAALTEIEIDLNRLADFEFPETDDEPYDRLCDRIVEWVRAHPEPIPNTVALQ
ncbi:hypothetical protein [Rhodococcus sp. ARC_M6]|uniref:hypothetical protein n=1 Tax=Rhodococcus sp. ARC_M6 TaxID=2928852 RepID=UPI001FB3B9EF|nr:hypothetical protein [Rhodococcus sp. ARC_M6]MCJ0904408.1 hypothetical protein [Rhodococcus sp. ARC_M6]